VVVVPTTRNLAWPFGRIAGGSAFRWNLRSSGRDLSFSVNSTAAAGEGASPWTVSPPGDASKLVRRMMSPGGKHSQIWNTVSIR
jgi:hypothetical protein